MNILIDNLAEGHTKQEMQWIITEFYKFLQTESPSKAIFSMNYGFGLIIKAVADGVVKIHMVYEKGDLNKMQDQILP